MGIIALCERCNKYQATNFREKLDGTEEKLCTPCRQAKLEEILQSPEAEEMFDILDSVLGKMEEEERVTGVEWHYVDNSRKKKE